jgi:tRNA(fMet)-specific endonuclease VapC
MIRFVLDTDTCIYWLKGHRGIEQRVVECGLEQIAISVITACELTYGAWKSARREEHFRAVAQLQRAVSVLHTTNQVIQSFGRWKAHLEGQGIGLDDADLLIAAIASAHGCALVTNNERHFKRLPELSVENWVR